MTRIRKVMMLALACMLAIASIVALPAPARAADNLYTMMYFNGYPDNSAINNINNSGAVNHINTISPNAFSVNDDGTLKVNRMSDGFVDNLHAKGIKVIPYLSNHWSSPTGNVALQNHVVLAEQVAAAVQTYNFDGVNVDIENAKQDFRDTYTDFVRLLREKIPSHKEVSVAVAANPYGWTNGWHGSYDYKKLGEYADNLFIMAYDQNQSTAGPIAGYEWVEKSVKYALQYVPANKLVLGIPLYGRVWGDSSSFSTTSLRAYQFPDFARSVNASLAFDKGHQSPFGKFTVPEGNSTLKLSGKVLPAGNYEMWFEDTNSIQKKYLLAKSYGLKGVGFWAVGGEPSGFWGNYANWQKGNHGVAGTSGWQQDGNTWRYLDNGYPLIGWQPINGEYYYFDKGTGNMRTGWLFTNKWYYLKADGKMTTGWAELDGDWYYFGSDGAMATGWQQIKNVWYLFGDDGTMKTGWQVSGGKWYHLKSSGAMSVGWLKDGNEWYLLKDSGAMLTGWQQRNGKWYLMASSGKMLKGWQRDKGRWYYMDASGVMKTGWQKIDNKWYYMNSSGVMQTGTQRIGGKTYTFDSSGVWIS